MTIGLNKIHMIIFPQNLNLWNNFWHLSIDENIIVNLKKKKDCKATHCIKADKSQMYDVEFEKQVPVYSLKTLKMLRVVVQMKIHALQR